MHLKTKQKFRYVKRICPEMWWVTLPHTSIKLHSNRPCSFCVILLKNRETNGTENLTSLVVETNVISRVSLSCYGLRFHDISNFLDRQMELIAVALKSPFNCISWRMQSGITGTIDLKEVLVWMKSRAIVSKSTECLFSLLQCFALT